MSVVVCFCGMWMCSCVSVVYFGVVRLVICLMGWICRCCCL